MKRALAALAVAALELSIVGCEGGPTARVPAVSDTQVRLLGEVKYDDAFATAQAVFGRHFDIASADPQTGVITSEPKMIQADNDRPLANSPARLMATMVIRQQRNGQIVSRVQVLQQRQEQEMREVMTPPGDPYSSVPNETPAADLAATTPEQNSVWKTQRRDRAQESLILQELFDALHPATAAGSPASRPGQ